MLIKNWNPFEIAWVKWLLEAILLVAVIWGISVWQTRDLLPTVNVKAPSFELPALDGKIYRLTESQAQTTLIYFFAPWCKVCHFSIGNVEKLRQVRTAAELSIFLIALDWQNLDELKQFVAKHALTIPVLLGTSEVALQYRIKGIPTYYILDAEGNIKQRSMGYTTELELRWKL
jgi:peroxiredoxin